MSPFMSLTVRGNVLNAVMEIISLRPEGFTIQDVIDRAYSDQEPLLARRYVCMAVARARKHLQPLGWTVRKPRAGGGVKGIYRLERLA